MRSWKLVDGELALGQAAQPRVGARDVLVAVRAVALNYRDLVIRERHRGQPLIPASDAAGEVVSVGSDVEGLAPGDRVVGAFFPYWLGGPGRHARLDDAPGGDVDGVLADLIARPADAFVRIPDELGFADAATFPCAGVTAWNALTAVADPVGPGDVVLALGSGGVSVFTLQMAVLAGARAIMTSSSEPKLERLQALGADATIDHRRTPAWDTRVMELTDGHGADFVVDVGGADTIERSLRACARGGTVTLIGILGGRASTADLGVVHSRELTLRSVYVGPRAMLEEALRAFSAGGVRPVVDSVVGFEDAPAAFERLRSGNHIGKVVIGLEGESGIA